MSSLQSFFLELRAAFGGIFYLLKGDRRAATSFDFSPGGLASSFIPPFLVLFISLLVKFLSPALPGSVSSATELLFNAVLYAFVTGAAYLFLRAMGRTDGFVPYLVANNWSGFAVFVVLVALALVGAPLAFSMMVMFVGVMLLFINISRLIVTLSPLQIAMFLGSQVLGLLAGGFAVALLAPLSPEFAEALARAQAAAAAGQ